MIRENQSAGRWRQQYRSSRRRSASSPEIFCPRIIADLAVSWPHGYPCGPGWAHSGDELSGAVTKQSQPLLTPAFLDHAETLTIVNRAIGRGRNPVLSGVVREAGASSRVGGIG